MGDTTHTSERASLRTRTWKGGAWLLIAQGLSRGSDFAKRVILARLLSPNDFGLMGIALMVLNWLDYFTDTGIRPALIQKQGEIDRYFDTAWTAQLVRGAVLSGAVWLVAPLAAAFFDAPEATSLIRSLAIVLLLRGLTNPAVVHFRKNLDFQRQAIWDLSGALPALAVGIAIAVIYRSVWALALSVIAAEATRVFVSHRMVRYRPRFILNREQWKELLSFGKWVFILNAINFLALNLDSMTVGKILGTTSLGLYQMAYQCAFFVALQFGQIVSGVVFPALSTFDNSVGRTRAFLETLSFVASVALFASFALSLLAEPVVIFLFGAKWADAAPTVAILVWGAAAANISRVVSALFYASGAPNRSALVAIVKVTVLATTLWLMADLIGLSGVAYSVTIAEVLALVLNLVIAVKALELPSRRVLKAWRHSVLVSAPFLLAIPLRNVVPSTLGYLLTTAALLLGAVPVLMLVWRSLGGNVRRAFPFRRDYRTN